MSEVKTNEHEGTDILINHKTPRKWHCNWGKRHMDVPSQLHPVNPRPISSGEKDAIATTNSRVDIEEKRIGKIKIIIAIKKIEIIAIVRGENPQWEGVRIDGEEEERESAIQLAKGTAQEGSVREPQEVGEDGGVQKTGILREEVVMFNITFKGNMR